MNAELLRLIAAQVCLHASMAGMRMAAPLLALREGYSAGAVGVLLALFSLTQVFLAIPAGRFADRHGLQRPVGVSVAMASLGAGAAVIWPVFPVLCLSALLTGGATGTAIIALQRHVGRLATDLSHLRQIFSWLAIGPAISNFIGPLCAGLLIDHAGFQAAFAFTAVLPLLSWYWVNRVASLPPAPVAPDAGALRVWDLLHVPRMRQLLLVNWFLSSCWDVHTFMVPVLGHERGISASAIGAVLGGFAIAAALIRMILPWVAERLKEWQIITAAMLATAVLLGVYPLLESAWQMGVCSAVLGLFLGAVQPMVMSTLHQITPPERQGEALGLRLMTINACSVLMPVVFGAMGTAIGVGGVFWAVASAVAVGSRWAWTLRPHPHHG